MEMNEGYQDREDPGLTVRFPLVDRPDEALLVWTTTPWTLTSNVAAAVGEDLRYVKVRQGDDLLWLGKGTLKTALEGPFEVLEERPGRDLVGWRYGGPFDDLQAVREAFATAGYEHRIVVWDEVGEDEGTGIVHIAPGCGAEDFQLGKALGLPVVAPIDESGIILDGFGSLSGRDVRDVSEPIIEHLKATGRFYRLEPYVHRYPHCWRCGTPLVFRLVDEWFISMGPVYDQPRETLSREQVDASLRYQIMEVVDQIRWIPEFGYERELDWLRNMHDWMISKKRYWGLALPIYDCSDCGTIEVIGGREELRERAVEGWDRVRGAYPASAVGGRGQDRLPRLRRAGRADQGRRQPVAGRRHRAVLDAPLPRGPRVLGAAGSRPTSSPRASRASSATGSTRCSRCRRSCAGSRRSRRSSATPSCSARTAGRCTRAGATPSISTRPPSGWASTSCAGCSPRPDPRRTSSSAGTRPTRRAASCSSCGTCTRSS